MAIVLQRASLRIHVRRLEGFLAPLVVMKRSATTSTATNSTGRAKKSRVEVPEYHLAKSVKTESGEVVWPAPQDKIDAARSFILEW